MALPRVLTCLLIVAGVLVSSAVPGAEALSVNAAKQRAAATALKVETAMQRAVNALSAEVAKQRAVKAGLKFVKALLPKLFPPPPPAPRLYIADFGDERVRARFSLAVPLLAATKPTQFRLTVAGSIKPPMRVNLSTQSAIQLGVLGKNLQCSKLAPSVWDCFGQTQFTQADIGAIGYTAGVGAHVDSYSLFLVYPDALNPLGEEQTAANLKKAPPRWTMEQVFGYNDLVKGVPVAGRFQSVISGEQLKGGATVAIFKKKCKSMMHVSIILIHANDLKPAVKLSVVYLRFQSTVPVPINCTWARPRPSVHVCEVKREFPSKIDTSFLNTLKPAHEAVPPAVDLELKVVVVSQALAEASQDTLRYTL
ncbi:unnamed protein product [Closterium sp. Naga37s-1]|nr:unnamed protein product [Closterium sp. Naga37s-1]